MNEFINPNVKTDWTDHALKLLGDQLNVYFFHIQKLEGVDNSGLQLSRQRFCSVCSAVDYKCHKCPILFKGYVYSCIDDPTYITINKRHTMTLKQAKKRLKRLIQYYEANGLEVFDE